MASVIFGIIAVVAVLTGCGFYFIPKYAMQTSNSWITAIDDSIKWIGNNWIVFTIIVVLAVALITSIIILCKKHR